MITRCKWPDKDPLMIRYHDEEWGVPLFDDRKIFEFIVLDAFQAGLNWKMILKKREHLRTAFSGFDPKIIAQYRGPEIDALLENKDIIRNKAKINGTVVNARLFLDIQKEWDTFTRYIWNFSDNKVIHNAWKDLDQIPARSVLSDEISMDLKKRGFKFAGTTIVYAFIQAMGMVNDHTMDCFRYEEIKAMSSQFPVSFSVSVESASNRNETELMQ